LQSLFDGNVIGFHDIGELVSVESDFIEVGVIILVKNVGELLVAVG
jgi:hypothetical protein